MNVFFILYHEIYVPYVCMSDKLHFQGALEYNLE